MKSLKESSFTVHDLPRQERPRERLARYGVESLSGQELLAILIGRGVSNRSVMTIAQDLVTSFGNIRKISEATIEELTKVRGIGFAKATQIKACFELGKRQEVDVGCINEYVGEPGQVAKLIRVVIKDKAKEHFFLLLLNTRNKIIQISHISTGTLNSSLVHPREVFKEAIKHSAQSVIIVHNHPSDDTEPSDEDLRITQRLVKSGDLLGIEVLDHVIVGKDTFFSFREKGLI